MEPEKLVTGRSYQIPCLIFKTFVPYSAPGGLNNSASAGGGSSCLNNCLLFRFGLGPCCGRELFDLCDLGGGQTGEQVFQIIERIDAMPPTTAQQGVNHCAAFPRFRMPNEHPIAFSKRAWTNRIFDFVVINFKNAVGDKLVQSRPSFQRVINRLSKQTLRQGFSPHQRHPPAQPV